MATVKIKNKATGEWEDIDVIKGSEGPPGPQGENTIIEISTVSDISNVVLLSNKMYQLGQLNNVLRIVDILDPIDINILNTIIIMFTTSDISPYVTIVTDKIDRLSTIEFKPNTVYEISIIYNINTNKWEGVILGDPGQSSINFAEANTMENINTGETSSIMFGKIKRWYSDVISKFGDWNNNQVPESNNVVEALNYLNENAGSYTSEYGEGYVVTVPETVNSIFSPRIEGNTLNNLARLDLPVEDLIIDPANLTLADGIFEFNSSYSNFINIRYNYDLNRYKPNTKYTVVLDILELASGITSFTLNTSYVNQSIMKTESHLTGSELTVGRHIRVLTTKDDITMNGVENATILFAQKPTGNIGVLKLKFMIFEGDISEENIPYDVNQLESTSVSTIKSNGINLFDDKALLTMSRSNVTVSLSGDKINCTKTATGSSAWVGVTIVHKNTEYQPSVQGPLIPITNDPNKRILVNRGSFQRITLNYFKSNLTTSDIRVYDDFASSVIPPADCKYITLRLGFNDDAPINTSIASNIIVAEIDRDIATIEYIPYQSSQIDIPNITLHRLPNGVCDYIENGLIYRNLKFMRILEMNSQNYDFDTSYPEYIHVYKFIDDWKVGQSNAITTKFGFYTENTGRTLNRNELSCHTTNNSLYLTLDINEASTLAEVNAWLIDNPIFILYELVEPTIENANIPDRWLNSYDDSTTVTSLNSNVKPIIKADIVTKIDNGLNTALTRDKYVNGYVEFEEPSEGSTILESGDTVPTLFGKIKAAISAIGISISNLGTALNQTNSDLNDVRTIANGKYTAQDATTARKGIVQLTNSVTSTSTTTAATANAVKVVQDNANTRVSQENGVANNLTVDKYLRFSDYDDDTLANAYLRDGIWNTGFHDIKGGTVSGWQWSLQDIIGRFDGNTMTKLSIVTYIYNINGQHYVITPDADDKLVYIWNGDWNALNFIVIGQSVNSGGSVNIFFDRVVTGNVRLSIFQVATTKTNI